MLNDICLDDPEILSSGFGYGDYPNQSRYGISLSSIPWVIRLLQEISDLRLVHISEKSWDSLQDVYGLVNEPGWSVRCEPISMKRLNCRAGCRRSVPRSAGTTAARGGRSCSWRFRTSARGGGSICSTVICWCAAALRAWPACRPRVL